MWFYRDIPTCLREDWKSVKPIVMYAETLKTDGVVNLVAKLK